MAVTHIRVGQEVAGKTREERAWKSAKKTSVEFQQNQGGSSIEEQVDDHKISQEREKKQVASFLSRVKLLIHE